MKLYKIYLLIIVIKVRIVYYIIIIAQWGLSNQLVYNLLVKMLKRCQYIL